MPKIKIKYDVIQNDRGLNQVECMTKIVMKDGTLCRGWGIAICAPADEFDFNFGKRLAKVRAIAEMYAHYAKTLVFIKG